MTTAQTNTQFSKNLSFHFFEQSQIVSAVVLGDKAFLIPKPNPAQPKQRGKSFFPVIDAILARGEK